MVALISWENGMRWIIRIVFVLVSVLVVAFGALFLIPADRILAFVGDQFQSATGRTLVVSGKIKPSIYPVLGLYAEGIEIGNPAWVGGGPMLRAQRLDIGVALSGLFSGDIRVERLELTNPEILLVRAADGAVNWDFTTGESTSQPGQDSSLADFSLDIAKINGGSILYRDLSNNTEFSAKDLALTLRLPSLTERASLEGNMEVNGSDVSFTTSIDGIGPLLDGASRSVGIKLDWDGGNLKFSGLFGLSPLRGNGDFSFSANDLGPLLALAGQSAPELPHGLGREKIAANGTLKLGADGAIQISGMSLELDDNRLSGNIAILQGDERPIIRAQLQGGALDFSGLTDGGSTSESASTGWSRNSIDVSALHSVDADIALTLSGLDLGILTLGTSDIRTTISAGRMVVKLKKVAAYGGAISGEYVVNGRGGLSMGGNLAASNIQLNPLLSEFANLDRLEGIGSGRVTFLLVGNDMNTLMNSLSGSGNIEFGQGAILGLDIAGMITNLDTSYQGEGQKTVYDKISASFTMKAGIVSNDDLIMAAPFGELTGSGVVGVGQQNLDYTVIPHALYTEGKQDGLRVPLNISGPWSAPKFKLDLEALAKQELQDELDTLEERATDAITGAITNALGIEPIEGEAPATLEEQLESAAAKKLQQLLGIKD